MRFWIKISVFMCVSYVACNASFLLADQKTHRAAVREVEAATYSALQRQVAGAPASEVTASLINARQRYMKNDASWQRDACRLLLLNN